MRTIQEVVGRFCNIYNGNDFSEMVECLDAPQY